ncbi:hypothetical protein LEP1GSC132_1353 [Leptospira kirschneri str. 200803703]|uniref:Uncharacterized protein n=3 Tax=Leptospira kirschneri TaxID=29507 RepID=A0A0E2B8P1_9LEPT|nr:hypothetical protein LEP1GSC081_2360 [Leptospira kirschneri str. H1]EKO52110.1 hypothetical protein LEP1GSC131_4275 [Leptospira kirschneri str. 200802841]EKO62441.1 hypothetical protein LEP1GSC082_4552 [Leptospira kirschneri str. H2]EMJ87851.1 hypothetical protein LEP1GSC198_3913 [Leptospira kirschneri str. JB]EMK10167.1 hypothetical protein LEP1GSC166_1515 [Leptospira kirschneri]EMK12298.1 hypothetical protein LEP1GSC042_0181 [Leptospira kirschneri serovar Bim str. PUO 1247]EMK20199.1 hyp
MVEINLIEKGRIHILLFYWTRSFIQIKDFENPMQEKFFTVFI